MAWISEFVAPEFVRDALSRLNISLSDLRDAIRGAGNRTLTDLYDQLASIYARLDVAISTRASETTLAGIKSKTDLLTFDASNRLIVNVGATVNPPALDVNLSTRASESTLSTFSGKFPSATALADNLSNPTTTIVGAANLGWDGSAWRRLAVDTSSRLKIVAEVVANPPNLDVALSTRASESTLVAVRDRLPSSLTAAGNFKIAVQEDAVGLLKEATFTGRFPAGTALGDTLANPTTTLVGSCGLVWDGSNWRRLSGVAVDVVGSTRTAIGTVPMWLPSRQAFLVDNINVTTTEGSTSIASPGAKILIIKNKGDVDALVGLNASVPTTNPLVVRARTVRVVIHSGVTSVYYKTATGSTVLEIAYFN